VSSRQASNLRAITALAILKVNMDAMRADYLDCLLPFVGQVLADEDQLQITTEEVSRRVVRAFGLRIPHHTIELLLRRLERRGYLTLVAGVYTRTLRLADLVRPMSEIEETAQNQSVLLEHVVTYASGVFGETWTVDDAAEAVLTFLLGFSADCLATIVQKRFDVSERLSDRDASFIVGSFICQAYELKSRDLDRIVELVKGNMLADALLCQDLAGPAPALHGARFYLDTPLLLDVLGATGTYPQAVALEWIALVQSLGGAIRAFDHLVTQTEHVLGECERRFDDPPAHDRVVRALRREGKGPSDVAVIRARARERLAEQGIAIKSTPVRQPRYQIDEEALVLALQHQQLRYLYDKSRDADVQSVAAIYQLRKDVQPKRLGERGAFLVTANGRLASSALAFARSEYGSDAMPAVITDYSLANAAWLKAPMAAPELPRLGVIAWCYSLLRPPEQLWGQYVTKIEHLVRTGACENGDVAILRFSLEAQEELMFLTRGSDQRLEDATIEEVLRRAKEEIAKDERRSTARERAQREALEEAERTRRLSQRRRAQRVARVVSWCLAGAAAVVLAGATLLAPLLPLIGEGWPFWLLLLIPAAAAAWAMVSGLTGSSPLTARPRLERRLTIAIESAIRHLAGERE